MSGFKDKLSAFYQATGIPGLRAAFREHAREVRKAQDDFQNRIQNIADTKGLDAVDETMKEEAAQRRKNFWQKIKRGPF